MKDVAASAGKSDGVMLVVTNDVHDELCGAQDGALDVTVVDLIMAGRPKPSHSSLKTSRVAHDLITMPEYPPTLR